MRKIFVLLLCMLALFSVVSCKNEPEPEPEPEPVKVEAGVLIVTPAEGATFAQSGKCQFKLDEEFNAEESIEFLAKFSEDITAITVRQGGGDNIKFLNSAAIEDLEQNADGWYIVTVDAESVVPTDGGVAADSWIGLGITLTVSDTTRATCSISIKDLKLNGVGIDFSEYDAEEYVQNYYDSPNEFAAEITK